MWRSMIVCGPKPILLPQCQQPPGGFLMKHLRVCVCTGWVLSTLLVLPILSGSASAAAPPDLSGIYWATQYNAKIQLVGGGELPFTAAGKAAYDKNVAALKA